MIDKIQRDHIVADIAALDSLLKCITDNDFMTRISLESRRDELKEQLARMQVNANPMASAALFFGGRPVVGRRGIESEFGANAIEKFQEMVSLVAASRVTDLKTSGPVPLKSNSQLHITHVLHGSFGFQLEEIDQQGQIFDTDLKESVDKTTELLSAFEEPKDESFLEAIEDIDERVLQTVKEFFELMAAKGATVRIVSGEVDKTFDDASVALAVERATMTELKERIQPLNGLLAGVLPAHRQFEYESIEYGLIYGKIDKQISDEQVINMNQTWTGRDSSAIFLVKEFSRRGKVYRQSYKMLSIQERR